MGFNKIKSITNDPVNIFEAIKDSEYVELNEDKTKIRKKKLRREFLNNENYLRNFN